MHDRRGEPDFVDAARIEAALREARRARTPDPERLRLACLLVYVGLMLTLLAVFGTAQALPEAGGSRDTAPFGIAAAPPSEAGDPETLIQRADRAMYRAKRAGGNRVRSGERD